VEFERKSPRWVFDVRGDATDEELDALADLIVAALEAQWAAAQQSAQDSEDASVDGDL
jgi:hypothetical protein